MKRLLILFEDSRWRELRPLTDLTPVPALAFGASTLALRWQRATAATLLAVEARRDALANWGAAPPRTVADGGDRDPVLVANAAALPGPWLLRFLDHREGARVRAGDRWALAIVTLREALAALDRGAPLDTWIDALELPVHEADTRVIARPWNVIEWNAEAIAADLSAEGAGTAGGVRGDVHPTAVMLEPQRIAVEPGARIDPLALLDARGGPILIERDAIVLANTVVVGPCVVGAGTQLLSGYVSRSTFGPQCRVAGEVEECVWQGYGNKRHHGFVGHSVIGEWVNLGALTTTSDLKNNYGEVKVWVDGRELATGSTKIGSLIGAHVKTGIGTLLPTGGSIGVGANLFGGGKFAPKAVAAFAWWDGERTIEHRLDPFLATAKIAMSRRGRRLEPAAEAAWRTWFEATANEREAAARAR